MHKINALYTNEMIKIIRRPSVIFVLVLLAISSIFWPILLSSLLMMSMDEDEFYYSREYYEGRLKNINDDIGNADDYMTVETVSIDVNGTVKDVPMTLYSADYDQVNALACKECYEYILANYDFEKYPIGKTWLSYMTAMQYTVFNQDYYVMNLDPVEERDAAWLSNYETMGKAVESMRKALMQHEYEPYREAVILSCKAHNISDYSEPDNISRLAATDPNGELGFSEGEYLVGYYTQISDKKTKLDTGMGYSYDLPRILTDEQKVQNANGIKILEYKIQKHNTYDRISEGAVEVISITREINQFVLIILLILIAGSSVSQEMATGSIKSLIIAPVRRWKIFTAKLMSIVTWMLAASIIMSILVFISIGCCFGFDKIPTYLFVAGGAVAEMPFIFYLILSDLVKNIWIFFYALVAFMISCFTKNTGVSVGISVGMLLAHSMPQYFVDTKLPRVFLEFTPYANMNLVSQCFPYADLMFAEQGVSLFDNVSIDNPLWFSIAYVVILTFVVLFIAYDEFTRKDIQ